MLDILVIRAALEVKKRLSRSSTEEKDDEMYLEGGEANPAVALCGCCAICTVIVVMVTYIVCVFKAMNDQALVGMSCVPIPGASTPQVDIGSTQDLSAKYGDYVMEKDVYAQWAEDATILVYVIIVGWITQCCVAATGD